MDKLEGKLLIKPFSIYNEMTHIELVKQFFKNLHEGILILEKGKTFNFEKENEKEYFLKNYNSLFHYYPRIFSEPAGRFWKNVTSESGKLINVISFWYTIKDHNYVEKINSVLDYFNLNELEKNSVYVEFLEDYTDYNSFKTEMYTFGDYKNKKEQNEDINNESSEDDIDLLNQLKQGAHGNELNPSFGSRKQVDIANKSGYNTFAKYYAERHPFSESKTNPKNNIKN